MLMFLVYFGALDKDPLYLFTEQQIEDYLCHLFEHYMRPALLYLQETFSSPISLDNVCVLPLTDATDPNDVKMKCPNFEYELPKKFTMSHSKAWRCITTPFNKTPSHKNSWVTTIRVKIPKMGNHRFWQADSDLFHSVSWDVDKNNAIEIEVFRWGPSQQHANYHATQRAKDIICWIRKTLTVGFPQPSTFLSSSWKYNLQTCQVFQFGVKLNKMWRQAERAFLNNTQEYWETALNKLHSSKAELPELQFLIRYYEVFVPFIKFLPQTFLLMQMARFEDAARSLTELQVGLMSKETSIPMRTRSILLNLIEKRISQKELSLAILNCTIPIKCRYSMESISDEMTEII